VHPLRDEGGAPENSEEEDSREERKMRGSIS
jgi:hypothetical protein